MRIDQDRPYAISARGITSAERVMWITPDRVFYAGLLGTPTTRNYGALFVYVALDSEVKLSIDGQAWQSGNVAVLQPYTSHRVACDARHVVTVMMEPESVDVARLPGWLRDNQGVIEAEEFRRRVLRAHQEILRNGHQADAPMFDFDELVFGTRLPARSVDPRIAQVLERIRADPSSQALAQDCAEQVHLSFSRFLHLFKSEVGASFRSFRTWKRAQPAALRGGPALHPHRRGAGRGLSRFHPLQPLHPAGLRAQAQGHLCRLAQAARDRPGPAPGPVRLSPPGGAGDAPPKVRRCRSRSV